MLFIWFTHDESHQGLLTNVTKDVADTIIKKSAQQISQKKIPRSD